MPNQAAIFQSTTSRLATRAATTLASTTVTTSTAVPHMDPSSHVLLTLTLLVLFTLLLIGCTAVGLVAKTRWDRYRLHMMPLYQFDRDQASRTELTQSILCWGFNTVQTVLANWQPPGVRRQICTE